MYAAIFAEGCASPLEQFITPGGFEAAQFKA
jgi:hypothetical protein